MRFWKKLKFWTRNEQPFDSQGTLSLEARLGALEYEYDRLSHDVSMVLMPETRQVKRRYPV